MYRCKNCGKEITKEQYEGSRELCNDCVELLFNEFGTDEEAED